MNFALLWIDVLLASLLWVAVFVACAARIKRRWLRIAAVIFVVGFPLLTLAGFACLGIELKYGVETEPNWFDYSLSLLLVFVVTASVVLRQALRRQPGMPPAGATWSRAPLFVAFLIANSIGYMTLLDVDAAIRARCALLSVEISSLNLATAPAITAESQNAAPLYLKAFANMLDIQATGVNNPPMGDAAKFDPDEPATLSYLAQHASTLSLLRQATALPGCRFDEDLGAPELDSTLSSLRSMRFAAVFLQLHEREAMAHGHVASAVADAAAIIEMSRHCGQRPTLLAFLNATSINAVGKNTLREVLPAVKNKDELSSLRLEDPTSFRRILRHAFSEEERYFLHSLTLDAFEEKAPTFPPSDSEFLRACFRIFVLNLDGYLRFMDKLQSLSTQPYYLASKELPDKESVKAYGAFVSTIAPFLRGEYQDSAHGEADAACCQVAVAMTRYRLDHGSLPSHLDDLVPAYLDSIPIDPFDGHPLRLAIKQDKYIVYSIGPDGKDDGGMDMTDYPEKGDITFALSIR